MISSLPFSQAIIKGVLPFLSCLLTSAPFSIKYFEIDSFPKEIAKFNKFRFVSLSSVSKLILFISFSIFSFTSKLDNFILFLYLFMKFFINELLNIKLSYIVLNNLFSLFFINVNMRSQGISIL